MKSTIFKTVKKHLIKLIPYVLCIFSSISSANSNLPPTQISAVLNDFNIPLNSVSILVKKIGQNKPLLSINPRNPMDPASIIKILPTWVALEKLGPNFRWRTEFFINGNILNGVLDGDLVIKGYGDPYLLLEDLWKIKRNLSLMGINTIKGDVIINNSYFEKISGASEHRNYSVNPSALLLNFKSVEFYLFPVPNRNQIRIVTIPSLNGLKIVNEIIPTNEHCSNKNINLNFDNFGSNYEVVKFSGKLPIKCKSYRLSRPVMSPDLYFYGALKSLFEETGGNIFGSLKKNPTLSESDLTLIHTHQSKPLGDIVKALNKWSNNVMTKMLVYKLGDKNNTLQIKRRDGVNSVTNFLLNSGVFTSGLRLIDGSGLSRNARCSAKTISETLEKAKNSFIMAEFISSLSVAGQDGTTRNRFKMIKNASRARLKTGTKKDVSSLAGYVFSEEGDAYSLVLIINKSNLSKIAAHKIQDSLLRWTLSLSN